jgi:dephospho-CoA kinase
MKILIFGPSGAGKTFVSSKLREQGIPAVDADMIDGLSSWFDEKGNKVAYPKDAGKEFLENHDFFWDREFLKEYLRQHETIYLFGGSGNIFEMLDLFDKVFFLKIDPKIQIERLKHPSRANPMGSTEYQRQLAVDWGQALEQQAQKRNVPMIDGNQTPAEILRGIEEQQKERLKHLMPYANNSKIDHLKK